MNPTNDLPDVWGMLHDPDPDIRMEAKLLIHRQFTCALNELQAMRWQYVHVHPHELLDDGRNQALLQ